MRELGKPLRETPQNVWMEHLQGGPIDVCRYVVYDESMNDQHTLTIRHKNDPCCLPVRSPSMTAERTVELAERLKAFGDVTRLRMLDLLVQQDTPVCVCDITPHFEQNQPTVSHHLKLLREARLIDTEKRGIWAYYWATNAGREVLAAVQSIL